MDKPQTTCGKPAPKPGRCRTTTFCSDKVYVLVTNNHGGIPCTEEPYRECWSCWGTPCKSCVDLYHSGKTWGPVGCQECADNAYARADPTADKAQATRNNTVERDDQGAGSALHFTPFRNADSVTSFSTDREQESTYNGNMDSPDTIAPEESEILLAGGTATTFDLFLATLGETGSLGPVTNTLGAGGLATADENLCNIDIANMQIIKMDATGQGLSGYQDEPMEVAEDHEPQPPNYPTLTAGAQMPLAGMEEDAGKGEKEKPRRNSAPSQARTSQGESSSESSTIELGGDDERADEAPTRSPSSLYVENEDARGMDAAGLADYRRKRENEAHGENRAHRKPSRRSPERYSQRKTRTPRMQAQGRKSPKDISTAKAEARKNWLDRKEAEEARRREIYYRNREDPRHSRQGRLSPAKHRNRSRSRQSHSGSRARHTRSGDRYHGYQ